MSETQKKKAEFFKLPPSGIDWSDPESVSQAMDDIFQPFGFERPLETDDSRPADVRSVNESTEAAVEQDA